MNRRSIFNILGSIAAGIMGGGCFLLFFVLLRDWNWPVNILLPIVIGIAAYIGGLFIFPAKAKSTGDAAGETLKNLINECSKKVEVIRSYEMKITKPSFKSEVEVLCITFDEILDDYKKEPQDIKAFIDYYLDSAIKIIKKYVDLSEISIKTVEIENIIQKSEGVISALKDALTKQMANSMQDDMIDLDAEISVLEKTLKSEGL
jgi:5-bromo-4-chloroindolyl phosphate hydrolysis protein